MFNDVFYLLIGGLTTALTIFIGTALSNPASNLEAELRRWAKVKTPEFLEAAFTTKEMYTIAEKTARRQLHDFTAEGIVALYNDIFAELRKGVLSDGWAVKGKAVNHVDKESVEFEITLCRDDEVVNLHYVVDYLHALRVCDTLSPELLRRLHRISKAVKTAK